MDIRVAITQEVAEMMGAVILPTRCRQCEFPLMGKDDQGYLPFCWGCTTDKTTASEGRALLIRVKLAEKGILMPSERAYRMVVAPEAFSEPSGPFRFGMPL